MNEIMTQLGINVNLTYILVFGSLIWVRMLTIISVVPFLFGKPVPKKVTVGASMVLSAFAYKYLITSQMPPITEDIILLSMLYLKEAFVGVLIGFGAALIFYGFEAAGAMIDNQRGMSIARILIPELGTQGSLMGNFLFQLAIVIYLTVGGHHLFFSAIYGSYDLIPIFEFPNVVPGLMSLMDFFIQLSGQIIVLSIKIAAPVIISILVADIILGITNRVAPQINVWELGFNVKGYIGVLAIFWAITMVVDQIQHYCVGSSSFVGQIIDMLRGVSTGS